MGSRARGTFDLLPVETPCDLLKKGLLQAQGPHPCLLRPVPPSSLQHCSEQCLVPAAGPLPHLIRVLLQGRQPTSTAHLGRERPPMYLLSPDWEEPSTGSTLVSPQESSLGTDPGTGVGITAEHWWDMAACEMPLVFKPSADCTLCLVLNLPSLAGIPAWAPSKAWEIRRVPLPTAAQK